MRSQAKWLSAIREASRLFREISTPYIRGRLSLAALAVALKACLGAVPPLALKGFIDGFSSGSDRQLFIVVIWGCSYVLSHWLVRILGSVQSVIHAQADRRMHRALSDYLFDHVMRLPLRYHMKRQTGAVQEVLESGLMGYHKVTQVVFFSAIPIVVQLVTIIAVMLNLEQQMLLLLVLITMIFYGAAFTRATRDASLTARDVSSSAIHSHAVMTDSILNYETVKYFAAESFVRRRVGAALERSELDWVRLVTMQARSDVVVGTVFAVFLGATTWYAGWEVWTGRMTIGTLVLVNAYMLQLVAPIEAVGGATRQLAEGFAFLEKMLDLFREKPEPPALPSHVALTGKGKLEFRNVSVSYQSEHPVLNGTSFLVQAGRTLGIVGSSGGGKTTVLRLIVRLVDAERGEILIDDVPIEKIPLTSLRRSIAVVPQDTVLFDDSLAYNIAFGRPGCSQADIEQAAKIAELHHFIIGLPDGYNTRVGERGVRLSGGERQRVSIARAALKRPLIYVFDEATSSLDSATEQQILRNLRQLSVSSTTVIIAHRLSTVVHADEIILIHGGAVAERGAHADLLALEGQYAALWRAQSTQRSERSVAVY